MRCFQRDTCLSVRRFEGDLKVLPPEMQSRYSELFADVDPTDTTLVNFCQKYLQAIAVEEQECMRSKMVLWNSPVSVRLQMGRCVRIKPRMVGTAGTTAQIVVDCLDKFNDSWLNVGDAIVISTHRHHGLAIGYIVACDSASADGDVLTLSLDRPLQPEKQYVMDKDELTGSFGVLRANICKLLGNKRLQQLIVNNRPPSFTEPNNPDDDRIPDRFTKHLDDCQRSALKHVLSAQDYALIVGMPGTGKTTTLAAIIAVLLWRGETVLLVSHTHAAIDNVLMRLIGDHGPEYGERVLRIGPIDRVHEKVKEMTAIPTKLQQDCNEHLNSVQLVAGTTQSTQHHPLFMKRRSFSWCIVDEATQLTLPACLGALRFAQRFVLVGDPHQLPPLVRSRHPAALPLHTSLHHLLFAAHPQSAATLHQQYRMNEEIMSIANRLVYDGKLVCGSAAVGRRRLDIDSDDVIVGAHRPVVFIDTDLAGDGGYEERVGTSFCNHYEAGVVQDLVERLLKAGLSPEAVAVISPFRPQLRLLRAKLPSSIELATVDRFQGRDFPCVIVSLVRNNPLRMVGELVADWQRINVAFTRAQCKLIVVGSRSTLRESVVFDLFLRLCDERQWIVAP